MKFLGVILCLAIIALVVLYLRIPKNTFITISQPGGGGVTVSRGGVSLRNAPDRFATNAFAQIETYIARLLDSRAKKFASVGFFTLDGNRGFSMWSNEGKIEANFSFEVATEASRESAVRSFFAGLNISPTADYLAGNGGVPDATRMLSFPVKGTAKDLAALAKTILEKYCAVLPSEGLSIDFTDR